MRPGARLVAALCLLATFLPLEAANGQTPVAAGERAAIQELLDRRAEAVLSRDRAAFAATIDPGATAFRRDQLRMFDRARSIRFATYDLTADWTRYGNLARPADGKKYADADAIAIPLTQERYRVRSFDPAPAVEDVYFTFVRREGRWYIGGDSDLEDIGLFSVRHPWDFARLSKATSESFMALRPQCSSDCGVQSELLDLAESSLKRLDAAWPVEWSRKVILVVPPSDAALARMLQASFDPSRFVAFAYATIDPDDLSYAGNRILVNPPVIAGRPREEVIRILTHELLHVATRELAGPFIPLFIDEGIAEFVGYGGVPGLAYLDAIVGSGAFDHKLPQDFSFSSGSGNDIYLSYQEGQSAVRYFIDTWGMKRFVSFYKRLGRARVTAGLAGWHLERALRQTIGIGLRGFEKRWASSIGS
ncbi:MAG TPA: hypothetical protein VG929_00460 [Actinomycetota bacterium]|nr:hypothetical protein [Actinomycetota bacterium]